MANSLANPAHRLDCYDTVHSRATGVVGTPSEVIHASARYHHLCGISGRVGMRLPNNPCESHHSSHAEPTPTSNHCPTHPKRQRPMSTQSLRIDRTRIQSLCDETSTAQSVSNPSNRGQRPAQSLNWGQYHRTIRRNRARAILAGGSLRSWRWSSDKTCAMPPKDCEQKIEKSAPPHARYALCHRHPDTRTKNHPCKALRTITRELLRDLRRYGLELPATHKPPAQNQRGIIKTPTGLLLQYLERAHHSGKPANSRLARLLRRTA